MTRSQRWAILAICLIFVLVVGVIVGVSLGGNRTGSQPVDPERQTQPGAATVTATPASQSGTEEALGSGQSATSSWYQVYFTAPIYPDNRKNHQGGLDTHLVDLMNRATKSIDVADYGFNLENVADAMARAKARGVRVRMVTDTDTLQDNNKFTQAALNTLKKADIPIVDDRRPAIMHNKFTVVDKEWVETGSWNYTDADTYQLNNNMIIIHSKDLAENYTNEFEKMFVRHDFGPAKDTSNPHPNLTIDGTPVRNCFAPEGKCADLIIQTVRGARQSIDFMAFSFTHDGIGQAMIARAKAGVDVQGVFETTGSNTEASEYGKMKSDGLEVYTDGNPWFMHHKVIIIDNHIVIFGSFNFSNNADRSNDENLLIIDNADLAKAFTAEFDRVLAVAKSPPSGK